MKYFVFIVITYLSLSTFSFPQEVIHNQVNLECNTCHTCEVPTKNDPCLIECPRPKMQKEFPSSETGPDIFIMDELENRYLPVVFTHKLHAQMSDMTGGCLACHHYNTLGPILRCNQCHSEKRKRTDISKPDLMAAYHQQCLDCHRQWSHKNDCTSCHAEKKGNESFDRSEISSELTQKTHPEVKKPVKIIYQTDCKEGKLVTFFHDQHINIFGLDCISCHKNENCISCHDPAKVKNGKQHNFDKPIMVNISETERHQRCFGCHENDKCSLCHKNSEMKPFDHGLRTGWALNKNHLKLECTACHTKDKGFTKLENECVSCHRNWNSETFDHKVTGLMLDEIHIEFDCSDCHLERDFSRRPSCGNCHDDKNFPNNKPGKLVN